MQDEGVSANLSRIVVVGVIVIVVTIILAAAVIIAVLGPGLRPGQSPVQTLGAMAVPATVTKPLLPSPPSTSTPIPAPTAAPEASPAATVFVGVAKCLNASGEELSVRAGPGVEYDPPLGALSPGEVVTVIGKNAQQATWTKISAGELKGWVLAELCVGDYDPNQIPIIYVADAASCQAQVPDLTRIKIDQAEQEARQAQLVPVRNAACMPEGDFDLGDVVAGQSLMPDSTVACGTQILLTFFQEGEICPASETACAVSACARFGGQAYTLQPGEKIEALCNNRGYDASALDFCVEWTRLHSCISDLQEVRAGQEICLPPEGGLPLAGTLQPTPNLAPTDTPRPAPTPTPAPLAGRIYFPVFDPVERTYNIYSANLDGSQRVLVVAEASQPTVDAAGERIAYKSWQADKRGLMEHNIAGGDVWIFDPHFEAARPTFSPDARTLLFHSREGGPEPAIYRTVYREHEVLRREISPIQGETPAWLPNGTRFVYKGCLGNHCGLLLSDLDGGFPEQLTDNLSDINPTVSPDGQTIAFMSQTVGTFDIYTIGIDGSNRKQLTTDLAHEGLPTWSPDGASIAFVSDRGGEWAMWAMDADGGNQRLLFELGGSIDGEVWVDVQNSHGWLEETMAWAP